jgi:hypothetical protein
MIKELSLKSGGEYTVHILLHVKVNSLTVWGDLSMLQEVVRQNVPQEFWGLVTLWSERYMEKIYSTPFGPAFENPSQQDIHSAYRSVHMPLQWFAHEHPEHDFFWNWEMDIRYTGRYYEFFDHLGSWEREQPRKRLWERSAKYYIPALHGPLGKFTQLVDAENSQAEEPHATASLGSKHHDWPGSF